MEVGSKKKKLKYLRVVASAEEESGSWSKEIPFFI